MKSTITIIKVTILNLILAVSKIFFGIITFSQSLIVEGIDSLMDLINSIIALFASKHSLKGADETHPEGHGNSEYIASLVLSIIIVYAAIKMGIALINNQFLIDSKPNKVAIIVLIVSLFIKLFMALYILKVAKKEKNTLLKALGIENLIDLPKTLVALLGVLIAIFNLFNNADMIAGIIICSIILISGLKLFQESASNLLGKTVDDEEKDYIYNLIKSIKKEEINELRIVVKGPYYYATIDVEVDKEKTVKEGHDIASKVKEELLYYDKIKYVIVHVDPSK